MRLTPMEKDLARLLVVNGAVSHKDIKLFVEERGDVYSKNSVKVVMSRLRKKLQKANGVDVVPLYGEGYFMEEEDRLKIDDVYFRGVLLLDE